MIGRVENFARQLILESLIEQCRGIRVSSGYNTSPDVMSDPRGLNGNDSEHMLLVMSGKEEVEEAGVGGCHDMLLTITVYGYSRSDDNCPIRENNKLIQDLRNAVHQNLGLIAEYADRGLAFRLGDLETDEGALAHGGTAAFVQEFLFGYKNHSEW